MTRRLSSFKRLFSREKPSQTQPWHVFKELEDSLNLIEDFDQIALNFLGKIKESIPVADLALFIYDQDHARFRVSAFIGCRDRDMPSIRLLSSDPLAKWLRVNKCPLSLRLQPEVLDYLTPEERQTLGALGAELCYPILSMNRLIGILLVGAKNKAEAFSKLELSFISLLPQAGIALENALLFKEQRERFRRMSGPTGWPRSASWPRARPTRSATR